MEEIRTKRLRICRLEPDMAYLLHRNSLDAETRAYVPDEVFETERDAAQTLEYLISCYKTPESGPLVYALRLADGELAGYVQAPRLADGGREIGYHIAARHRGQGYATEAVKAFLPEIMRELNIQEIYGFCLEENRASA